jgi:NitT/TauT family transport system ATP-binding protein
MTDSQAHDARPMLEVVGVEKVFHARGLVALIATDLELEAGKVAAVIGPSGCGKSTLLNIIAGLLRPTYGEVRVAGKVVDGPRDDVGLMLQVPTLLDWRTAIENVLLPLEFLPKGSPAREGGRERAGDLLELVGLDGFEKHYPNELSGGMAQRVAICRMLIAEPNLLLLDEPFGALDELTREHMNGELQRIMMARGATGVVVTHSITEAIYLADTVYVMSPRPGRMVGKIDIDLARPRTIETMSSAAFADYELRVRKSLEEVGHAVPG